MNENQKGSILIILAISLAVIMLFIGLGVDTAMLGSSHQRQSRTAELGAMAATEAFLGIPFNNTLSTLQNNEARLAAARERAEEVVGFELNNFVSQIDTHQAVTGEIDGPVGGNSGERGELIPGQYFFAEPVGGCGGPNAPANNPNAGPDACPCPDPPNTPWRECFRPSFGPAEYDGLGTDDRPISAFKLNLKTSEASPIQSIFAHAGGGQKDFNISSNGISAITPRHVVFLIDLSTSMSGSTHDDQPPANYIAPPYSSVAFRVGACGAAPIDAGACNYPGETISLAVPRRLWQGVFNNPIAPFNTYNGMPICRPSAFEDDLFAHYRSDYGCYNIADNDGDPNTTDPVSYLVENGYGTANPRATNDGVVYIGPEPLSTVISGINETLQRLAVLAVPGDQITFIGFDDSVQISFDPVTNDPINGSRVIGPLSPGDPLFANLLNLTDLDDITDDGFDGLSVAAIGNRIQNQFFPKPGSLTDLSEAVLRAYVILTGLDGSEIADNQVIVFGDGIGNCPHSDGPSYTTNTNFPAYPDPVSEPFLTTSAGTVDFVRPLKPCNHLADPAVPPFPSVYFATGDERRSFAQGYAYYKSMTEVRSMVSGQTRPDPPAGFDSFSKNGFKFHAFLFGDYIQPHTLLRKGDPGTGCMSEGAARKLNLPFTDSGPDNASPFGATINAPFLRPNFDFQQNLAVATRGRFYSVRNACTPAQLNGVTPSTEPDFDLTDPDQAIAECQAGKGMRRLNTFCEAQGGLATGDVIDVDFPGVLQNGRLICDPFCFGKDDQVRLGIQDLFRDNPIIAVEAPLQ